MGVIGRALTIIAVTAALVVSSVLPAEALPRASTTFGPVIYFTDIGGTFIAQIGGNIASSKSKCQRKRKVLIESAPGVLFGLTRTNSQGTYVILGVGPRFTTYRITALKKKTSTVVCKQSSTLVNIA